MMSGKLIVISGPSGVGKGTICKEIIKKIGAKFSVSATTREKRQEEIEGVDYYYVSKDEFLQKIENDEFLEYNCYNGNYYGTLKEKVLNEISNGVNVLLEVDVNGARKIKELFPKTILLYIAPPSINELRHRLEERKTESKEEIERRIKIAEDELKQTDIYDYVVINDKIEIATKQILDIIDKWV